MIVDNAIVKLQNDESFIVLNNPLASPKFVREIGKGKIDNIEKDIYTPKVFYEIASKLNQDLLANVKPNENIVIEINIKDFLSRIGANSKNFDYLIKAVKSMQSILLSWIEIGKTGKRTITVPIISKSIHHEGSGKIELFVDIDLAKNILEVSQKQNFSFLKDNIFALRNSPAIKLYPFLKSWVNYGKPYKIGIAEFKEKFGYENKGYNRFSIFKLRVLDVAINEINCKTDIHVRIEATGEGLDGQKPRIKGLVFYIKSNPKKGSNDEILLTEPEIESLIKATQNPFESKEELNTAHKTNLPLPLIAEISEDKKHDTSKQQALDDGLIEAQLNTITNLFQKINFSGDLYNSISQDQIVSWLKANDFESIRGTLQYHIDKQTKIKSIGFFYTEGIWQQFKDYLKAEKGAKSTASKTLKKAMSSQEYRMRKEWYENLAKEYHEGLFQKWSNHIDSMDKEHLVNEINRLDILHKEHRLSSLYSITEDGLITWKKLGGHLVGKSVIGQLLLTGKIKNTAENTLDVNNWIKTQKGENIGIEKESFIIISALPK